MPTAPWAAAACRNGRAVANQLGEASAIVKQNARIIAALGAMLWPPPPCPDEGMALVGSTCVDRYEAHLVVPAKEDDKPRVMGMLPPPRWIIHPHEQRPPENVRYEARSAAGIFPQGYISRVEAKTACNNAGKRLCSFREWRRACRGKNWRRYPYGYRGRRGLCNISKEHLLRKFFGDSKGWKYDEHFNSPKLNSEPGFLARSGAYKECRTANRIYDLQGNLHEWVSSTVTDDFVDRLEEEDVERVDQPWVEGNGMFLGGFYSTTDQHGPGCYYTTIAHEPSYHDYSTGFRCCATARRPAAKQE